MYTATPRESVAALVDKPEAGYEPILVPSDIPVLFGLVWDYLVGRFGYPITASVSACLVFVVVLLLVRVVRRHHNRRPHPAIGISSIRP